MPATAGQSALSGAAQRRATTMLSAFGHQNFRLFFAVQAVSNIGTWIQITVENWLVLELSHSGLALAVTNALQFGPSVLLGLYGGVIADRHDRRRMLLITQTCLGVLALVVGLLAGIGIVRVWIIWLAAGCLGVTKCFDMPALQGFVKDLVGPSDLPNAVAWTNAVAASGRMLGPACGGVILTEFGAAPGFLINAATFGLVVLALGSMRRAGLVGRVLAPRAPGQVRQGLAYLCGQPVLATVSAVMIVVFIAAYNFQISLALIAADMLAGGGQTYGSLMSALGLGAAVGSLICALVPRTGPAAVLAYAGGLGAAQMALATVHALIPLLAATFAYGVGAGLFSVTVISALQVHTAEEMRGRVMALYSVCFLGSSPIGGPCFAALSAWIGVSGALRVTASVCIAAALVGAAAWRSLDQRQQGASAFEA